MVRVDRSQQLLFVGGEPLDQVQAVGADEDREARALRLVLDELQQLLPTEHLVVMLVDGQLHLVLIVHVDQVVEQDVERAFFRGLRQVHKSVGRSGGRLGGR